MNQSESLFSNQSFQGMTYFLTKPVAPVFLWNEKVKFLSESKIQEAFLLLGECSIT